MIIKNLGGRHLVTAKWLPLNGYPHMGGLFREKAIFRALQVCFALPDLRAKAYSPARQVQGMHDHEGGGQGGYLAFLCQGILVKPSKR